ncbi:MAG: acetylornithine/succinylornithine family transaminase [Ignavibacteriales bacterium]|nr:acetylornithine/succinylornithine family transaminase [Ignavibacteriales bacterium]
MDNFQKEHELFFNTYKRLPLEIESGEGCYLFSKDGNKYLDLFGGLAVNSLGYSHPKIIEAIEKQIRKYNHLSNTFLQTPQVELAELLLQQTKYKKVFFTNSGTEAIESAMKLVRKWGKKKNKVNVFGMSNGFSGRTYGALSIMDKEKYKSGYEPFLPNTSVIRFNDVDDLISKVNETTGGIFLEFIQGEGGIVPASKEFIEQLFLLREKFDFLIIADEIQAGIGRTGKFFCFEHYNVQPDVICFAKAVGGGLPLGGILGNEKVADVFTVGVHGTTFGGNPVACCAGIATVKEILENGIMQNAIEVGNYFLEKLCMSKNKFPNFIKEVRGKGMMLGVELTHDGSTVAEKMLENGVLINCTNVNVLRLLPPLILSKEQVDDAMKVFEKVFSEFSENNFPVTAK